MRFLLTVQEAADALGVSAMHIKNLIAEADVDRASRWRFGREIIDISPKGSQRRTLRINFAAVIPETDVQTVLKGQD